MKLSPVSGFKVSPIQQKSIVFGMTPAQLAILEALETAAKERQAINECRSIVTNLGKEAANDNTTALEKLVALAKERLAQIKLKQGRPFNQKN